MKMVKAELAIQVGKGNALLQTRKSAAKKALVVVMVARELLRQVMCARICRNT